MGWCDDGADVVFVRHHALLVDRWASTRYLFSLACWRACFVFFVYVLVNGGMISGLLPVVGVPMPLMSYGGTSAVSLLVGFGLVMGVRSHRRMHHR